MTHISNQRHESIWLKAISDEDHANDAPAYFVYQAHQPVLTIISLTPTSPRPALHADGMAPPDPSLAPAVAALMERTACEEC